MSLNFKSSEAAGDNLNSGRHLSRMPPVERTVGQIIKQAIKDSKTSQRELARKLGISDAAVSQWVHDDTVPDRDKVEAIVKFLEINPRELDAALYRRENALLPLALSMSPDLQRRIAANAAADAQQLPKYMPVWASSEGGDGAMIVNSEPIDQILRPEGLTAREAFCVYQVGESMSPAYDQGDKLFVNPTRPALSGTDCLFLQIQRDGTYLALTKRLVRPTADKWRVRQYNPPKDFDLDRKVWGRAWVIVGKMNRG